MPTVTVMPLPNSAAIKAIRQARGMKGVELAKVVGVTHGHLFNLENPQRRKHASEKVLADIAAALGVPAAAVTIPEAIEPTRRRRAPAEQAA